MSDTGNSRSDQLWPTAGYLRQVESLRAAVGNTIYLVELAASPVSLGIRQTGQAHVLLDVITFPRPDPANGLAPHMIILDDGRGINLGRIIRVSLDQPFDPAAAQILYQDEALRQQLLLRERRLSRKFIAERARLLLGQTLGRSEPPTLTHSRPERQQPLFGEQDHRKEAQPGYDDQKDDQSEREILEGKPVAHGRRSRQ